MSADLDPVAVIVTVASLKKFHNGNEIESAPGLWLFASLLIFVCVQKQSTE